MTIYNSGGALSAEIADRMAFKIMFAHDYEFQTSKTFDSQRMIIPRDCKLIRIYAEFKTAPTGSDAIFNIKKNGVEIWSGGDRPTLANGSTTLEKSSISEALQEGDYLEWVDVQPGSSTVGGYGMIWMEFE